MTNAPMINGTNAQSMLSASTNQVHSTVNVTLDTKVMVLHVMISMNVRMEPISVTLMQIALIPLVRTSVDVIVDMLVMVLIAVISMNVILILITVIRMHHVITLKEILNVSVMKVTKEVEFHVKK